MRNCFDCGALNVAVTITNSDAVYVDNHAACHTAPTDSETEAGVDLKRRLFRAIGYDNADADDD